MKIIGRGKYRLVKDTEQNCLILYFCETEIKREIMDKEPKSYTSKVLLRLLSAWVNDYIYQNKTQEN